MKLNKSSLALLGAQALMIASNSQAQTTLKTVDVREAQQQDLSPNLSQNAGAASRLGLSIKETPASVEVITQEVMEQRGARTFEEALRGGVGITAGGNPGGPSLTSTRGFTGGFVSYLRSRKAARSGLFVCIEPSTHAWQSASYSWLSK